MTKTEAAMGEHTVCDARIAELKAALLTAYSNHAACWPSCEEWTRGPMRCSEARALLAELRTL